MRLRHFISGAVVLGLIGAGSVASAQQGVINLDETVIKGRIQKPEAFLVLKNASLNYKSLEPKKSFIPELLETIKQDPF